MAVRLGIIGCGVIGSIHLKNAAGSKGAVIEAAADLIDDKRKRALAEYSPKKIYASGRELIADPDVEAVVLAFPTVGRADLAVEAFRAGKHVLVEKPAGMSAGDVERMLQAQGGLIGGCCSARFSLTAAAKSAEEFIADGRLGAIRMIHCRAIVQAGKRPEKPGPQWRLTKGQNGGGILVNWGVYDLDYLFAVTGWKLEPKKVFAKTWSIPEPLAGYIAAGSDAETYLAAQIHCAGGEVIGIERGEFMPVAGSTSWQIIGEKGSLRLNMVDEKTRELVVDRVSATDGVVSETLWAGEERPVDVHQAVLEDFIGAVAEKRSPRTDLNKALIVQRIIDGIYLSAETGAAEDI